MSDSFHHGFGNRWQAVVQQGGGPNLMQPPLVPGSKPTVTALLQNIPDHSRDQPELIPM